MATVREIRLPGVGVRHEFVTADGTTVGVLVHRDGRREIMVYDRVDPDACSEVLSLSPDDTRTLNELLGGSQIAEVVASVQQHVEGLSIEWITLSQRSPSAGHTIGEGMFRTRTGCSIVAVIRGEETFAAPGPEFMFAPDDVVVAVGTSEGLDALRALMQI